ncbi:MAG TPA: DinB family protein [Nitrolancea sp.]|jgi:uncharacterized damage-inducible protein DinB|nr:DinB family protein [Nitrolancea sp.]
MNESLREIFRYHTWATLRLLDHCTALPPEQLDETIPGTMGTIHDTFVHIISSDAGYQARLRGDASLRIRDAKSLPLSELRGYFVERSKGWEDALDHLDDFDPTLEPEDDHPDAVPHVRDLLLAQAIHHGNDHRTHICSILGANEHEVPETDVWTYWFVTRNVRLVH